LLEGYGFEIAAAIPPRADRLADLDPAQIDVLLIDQVAGAHDHAPALSAMLASWPGPLLYNDAIGTKSSQLRDKEAFGRALAQRIHSLAGQRPVDHTAVNQ